MRREKKVISSRILEGGGVKKSGTKRQIGMDEWKEGETPPGNLNESQKLCLT
jgi:hypothetical protein